MLAVGAEEAWVFIRHEYGPEEQVIRAEIEHLRSVGLIGPDVAGTGRRLNIEVFTSPGGYILGEESALLECMEGHRGEPRNKPPFPASYGLHGKPTLMNSVETFAHVPVIALRGADWWNAQGAPSSTGATHAGLKFFAVSGHVERPGVYCVPMGTTARRTPRPGGRRVRTAGSSARSSQAARPPTSSARASSTSSLTSARCRPPGPCSAPARWSSWPRAPTCSPPPSTCCGSSATSRAASACRAGSAPPSRTSCSPTYSPRRRPGRRQRRRPRAGRRHAPHLHLRPRPGRPRPGHQRPAAQCPPRQRWTHREPPRRLSQPAASSSPPGRSPKRSPGSARRAAPEPSTYRISAALRRVTAEPVRAPHPLPGFARSTVDGYAVRAADTYGASEGLPGYLTVTGAVRMGAAPDVTVTAGNAVSMPTGGAIPPGADAVVMIEYTAEAVPAGIGPGTIEVVRPVAPGEGVVRADEDVAEGQELIQNGRVLRPQDLAMLAAAGVTSVARPRQARRHHLFHWRRGGAARHRGAQTRPGP